MTRNFSYSDEVLMEYGSTILGHLEDDLDAFTTFDPDLNQAKYDELDSLLETSLKEGGDELNVATLGDLTEKVLEEVKKSKLLFNQLRYWVIKAFSNRKAIQRQFGIGRFRKVSASQPRLVEFMFDLAESVEQHREALKAVGTSDELLDQVAVQAKALMVANRNQEKLKGSRTVDTEDRVKQLNELFDILRAFNNAAELVFHDQPARRELYRSPSSSQSVEDEFDEAA